MKNQIALIIITLLSLNIYTQNHDDPMINPLWDFYSFNYLSTVSAGKGFTGIASENDISGFNLNPASVNIPASNQINVQYTYKTNQPWLRNTPFFIDMNLKQQLFSGSVGYGKKITDKLQTGFIYNNPTGMYFDLGEFIKTDEFGNEIGRYDMFYNNTNHSFSIPTVYILRNIKLGLNLNYILSRYTIPGEFITTITKPEGFDGGTYSATTNYFKVHMGILFSIKDKLSLGVKVVSGGKSEVTAVFPDGSEGDQIQIANYPWKAGAGVQYSITKNIRVAADYNFTNTNMQEGLKDRHDGHIGIEGDINNNWALRGGFFTLLDYRKDEDKIHWIEPPGEYDQYFVTLGAGFKQKNFAANIAILTSEISTGVIKNTYVNGGLTFNF